MILLIARGLIGRLTFLVLFWGVGRIKRGFRTVFVCTWAVGLNGRLAVLTVAKVGILGLRVTCGVSLLPA